MTSKLSSRRYSKLDSFLIDADQLVKNLFGTQRGSDRANPADAIEQQEPLAIEEANKSESLMRINHAGEISAQALYQGQALTARDPAIRQAMQQSALEEVDHLNWCEERIKELGGHTSYLKPVWYCGSLAIGIAAGVCGDKWSLGFLVATENQVVKHLDEHLQTLPKADHKSRAIVEQMKEDEQHHADKAQEAGAAELPKPIKAMMRITAKIMTRTAYWV